MTSRNTTADLGAPMLGDPVTNGHAADPTPAPAPESADAAATGGLCPPGDDCYLADWIYDVNPMFKQIRDDAVALGLNPDAVLLTELARLAVLAGPCDVPGPRLTTLGIMAPLVGGSGDGKGTIQDLAERHLPAFKASNEHRFRKIGLGTGQGLAKAFYREVADPDPDRKGKEAAPTWQKMYDALWIVGSESGGIADIARQNNGANYQAMEAVWSREDPSRQNAGKDYNFPVAPGEFVVSASFAVQVARATALINSDTTGGGFAHRLEWCLVWRAGRPYPTTRDVSQVPELDWELPDGRGVEFSASVEQAIITIVWERGQVFRAADDMNGHLGARLAKLTLLAALARGSRRGEDGDLRVAQEIVRCSSAIRDWLHGEMHQQSVTDAVKRGIEAAAQKTGLDIGLATTERAQARLLARLHRHGSYPESTEPEHPTDDRRCSGSCLDTLFRAATRPTGRAVLDRMTSEELVLRTEIEGRRTPFYALTAQGLAAWRKLPSPGR